MARMHSVQFHGVNRQHFIPDLTWRIERSFQATLHRNLFFKLYKSLKIPFGSSYSAVLLKLPRSRQMCYPVEERPAAEDRAEGSPGMGENCQKTPLDSPVGRRGPLEPFIPKP